MWRPVLDEARDTRLKRTAWKGAGGLAGSFLGSASSHLYSTEPACRGLERGTRKAIAVLYLVDVVEWVGRPLAMSGIRQSERKVRTLQGSGLVNGQAG